MVTVHNQERPGMVLGQTPPQAPSGDHEELPYHQEVCARSSGGQCHLPSKGSKICCTPLQCPQKEHRPGQGHSGPLPTQQIHFLSHVQDDHDRRHQKTSPQGQLCSLDRHQRRILARPYVYLGTRPPRLQSGDPVLQVQGHALRPKHRPENIYETNGLGNRSAEEERHQHSCLPRRPASMGWVPRTSPSRLTIIRRISHEIGLVYKQKEVESGPISRLPVSRTALEHCSLQRKGPTGQSGSLHFSSTHSPETESCKISATPIFSWQPQLCLRSFASAPGSGQGPPSTDKAIFPDARPRPLPPALRACIKDCIPTLRSMDHRPLTLPESSLVAYTDASLSGWGFHFCQTSRKGSWSPGIRNCHINELELLTIRLLVNFIKLPPLSHFTVMCDNSTAVNIIRRGGSRSLTLNNIMFSITKTLQEKQLFLTARHIQGCLNILADKLSRRGPISTEWTLDPQGRRTIRSLRPTPQVDLFATHENAILDLFVSPVEHPDAWGVDAFSLDWNTWDTIYLFPPISLISKVLVKIRPFKGTVYLVTPHWPTRIWFVEIFNKSHSMVPLRSKIWQNTTQGKVLAPACLQNLVLWTLGLP